MAKLPNIIVFIFLSMFKSVQKFCHPNFEKKINYMFISRYTC